MKSLPIILLESWKNISQDARMLIVSTIISMLVSSGAFVFTEFFYHPYRQTQQVEDEQNNSTFFKLYRNPQRWNEVTFQIRTESRVPLNSPKITYGYLILDDFQSQLIGGKPLNWLQKYDALEFSMILPTNRHVVVFAKIQRSSSLEPVALIAKLLPYDKPSVWELFNDLSNVDEENPSKGNRAFIRRELEALGFIFSSPNFSEMNSGVPSPTTANSPTSVGNTSIQTFPVDGYGSSVPIPNKKLK
jgi:hypothetical protein